MPDYGYKVTFGDASFIASDCKVDFRSQVDARAGDRPGMGTTVGAIELWIDSTDDKLPHETLEKLFNYAYRPQMQQMQTFSVELHKINTTEALSTYAFQYAWISELREVRPPGATGLRVFVGIRALFARDPDNEATVS